MTDVKPHIWKLDARQEGLDQVYRLTTGTFKIGSLESVTYDQLVRQFGVPTINEPSGDNKIQVEWVFKFDDKIFTIYDWKTFDRDYTLQELEVWSIGGHEKNWYFFEALRSTFTTAVVL